MANPIEIKSRSLLLLIEQHGPTWVEQNHPNLMRDAVYYGYIKIEEIDTANESYRKKATQEKQGPHQFTLPLPKASLATSKLTNIKRIASITDFKTLETKIIDRGSYVQAIKAIDGICARDNKNAQPNYIKENGEAIYRPLTLRESMLAMVEDFNREYTWLGKKRSHGDRLALFSCEIATISAIVYHGTVLSKCKIVPFCKELLELQDEKVTPLNQLDYNKLPGSEIDLSDMRYNRRLTQKELLEHRGWLAALEDDSYLLHEFSNILFNDWPIRKNGLEAAMVFFIKDYRVHDQISPIILEDADNYCTLRSEPDLNRHTNFIRLVKS